MRLYEFTSPTPPDQQLMALTQLLAGRAEETNGPTEINVNAFIQLAKQLGVQVNRNSLGSMISQPPLSNVLEPFDGTSDKIQFKSNEQAEEVAPDMSVDRARDVVDSNAKRAMKRGIGQ